MTPPRILLVDDEPNIIKSLQRLLFEEDFQVYTASSGEIGLETLHAQEIDLIISDYRMPGMTGIEFLRLAREVQPQAIRIILSGYAEIQALTEAINVGNIYKFIFKPWNDEDLKNTIRLALEQKQLAQENQRLAEELKLKNQELERFNQQLEHLVERRTQELSFQNKVLMVWQEVLEYLPLGVMGVNDSGEIVLVNEFARGYFPAPLGQTVEKILPPTIAYSCRQALAQEFESQKFPSLIAQNPCLVQIIRFKTQETVNGAMIVFQSLQDLSLELENQLTL